jgi:shikimate dehydrogenase
MSARPGRLVLLGHPVHHSLSPVFQNAALRHAGVPLVYEALDVAPEVLPFVLRELVEARAAGNVTVPHKLAVHAACARRTSVAERTGAVNTFWVEDGILAGDNTDVAGFLALLDRVQAPGVLEGPVALLGAGGAASAVLAALESRGADEVRIVNRAPARASALAARFAPWTRPVGTVEEAVRGAHLVVNATTIGMQDDTLPVSPALLERGARVLDLVYRRGETPWVRAARARGHPAADGLEMLLAQGAAAYARWLGEPPDLAVMRAAVS